MRAFIWTVLWIACATGGLLLLARIVPNFLVVAWPLCLPGLLVLGDETQEHFGVWGELAMFWLTSLPATAALTALIRVAAVRERQGSSWMRRLRKR